MKSSTIRRCAFIALGLLFPWLLIAQQPNEVIFSKEFENRKVVDILQELSLQAPDFRFFFLPDSTMQTPLSVSFQQVTLDDALRQLLEPLDLGYISYRSYALVIGPKDRLGQSYTAAYYSRLAEITRRPEDRQALIIGNEGQLDPLGTVLLKGIISDDLSGDPVPGAIVVLNDSLNLAVANEKGAFSFNVAPGSYKISINNIGYEPRHVQVNVLSSGDVELAISKSFVQLEEVTIEAAGSDDNITSSQVGITKLDMKGIQKIPVLLGEVDIERILLLEPGVSKIAEGASGFNVRGGAVDQNLIMQDDGFLLNSSHALGFISTFNADMIQSVSLYKGYMPAQYGGRLSSVLDVTMRNASFEEFHLKAGLGPVASRLNLEIPVKKNKSSLNVGIRSTYADFLLKLASNTDVRKSSATFYDGQIRYAHKLNEHNNLEMSFYISDDDFRFSDDFGFDYSTKLAQMAWKSQINERWYSQFSVSASEYSSALSELPEDIASTLETGVSYLKAQEQLTYNISSNTTMDLGLSSIYYKVDPGSRVPTSEISVVEAKSLEDQQALESAVFIQTEWLQSSRLSLNGGLRFNGYLYLGPQTVFEYDGARSLENITDTVIYDKSEVIKSYFSVEPRFSFRYKLNEEKAIKGGYSHTTQFINQISNLDAPTPTSVWQLSNTHLQPIRAHNFSLGYFRNFQNDTWETSVEAYFRDVKDIIDYRDFADLNVNSHLETELVAGKARAYGLELSVKKQKGNFTGWLSYTLSRTERKIDEINNGRWYLSNFDKTHDISLVGVFQISMRQSFTVNFNYATGRPTTAPVGSYTDENGLIIPVYSQRNQLRVPDFHRLDISYTIGKGYNRSKKVKTSWSFSIYNLYGRKNTYSVFFVQKPFNFPTANRFAVLGSIFPSISFNIEIQ